MNYIPDTTKMVSLTLEQLREMDRGQPVLVECLEKKELSGWGYTIDGGVDSYHTTRFYDTYEKDWLAYVYPPANIDREAWEPCELCHGNKLDSVGVGDHFGLRVYLRGGNKNPPENERFQFCPKCGRPRTEEAWAELEKRLRG